MFHAKIERDAACPVDDGALDPPTWWQTRAAVFLLIVAAAIPLLYPAVPPLVDLPGHMAQYRIELDHGTSPDLQRYFTFHWRLIGNLGVDLLVVPLSRLFGLELATKLVIATIPLLTAAGFIAVARQVHGRIPATALLALPLAYSQPFGWGFVNYTLSMALAFLAFAGWVKLTRDRRFRLRAAIFVPVAALIYVAHIGGWIVLSMLAFAAELVRYRGAGSAWMSTLIKGTGNCLVLGLPVAMMILLRGDGPQHVFESWFGLQVKLFWLITLFRYNSQGIETAFAVVTFAALGFIAVWLRKSFSPLLALPAALLFLVFLVVPWRVMGSAHTDMRLAPYVVALGLLAVGVPQPAGRKSREIAIAALVFYAVVLTQRSIAFAQVANDQQRQLGALAYIPRGADVTTLANADCRETWNLTLNGHLGSYVIIRRNGFSNDQWIVPGANLIGLRPGRKGEFDEDPSQLVLPNRCPPVAYATKIDPAVVAATKGSARYLWLIDIRPTDPKVLTGWQRVWQYQESALYRRSA